MKLLADVDGDSAPLDWVACVGYDAKSGHPCHRDAVDTVIAACIHEHIGPRALCQFHIADIAHDLMLCGDCLNGRDPHHCVLVAVQTRRTAHG